MVIAHCVLDMVFDHFSIFCLDFKSLLQSINAAGGLEEGDEVAGECIIKRNGVVMR